MGRRWKVGELAALTGLTIRALRYYDQIGLFSPSDYSGSGHRLYNESDILRLQQIMSLKDLGLSLEEIQSVLAGDAYSPAEIVAIQIARLKENISAQQKLLEELERVSFLMETNEALTVDAFTKLLNAMKLSHEKYVIERRMSWERSLDKLGDYLEEQADE